MVDGKHLDVGPNLWAMLNALRSRNVTGAIWIDALCINQDKSDPQEKNEQIRVMVEIYETAKEVFVWLGESADDSDYVLETLSVDNTEAYTSVRFVRGLVALLKRPWWTRTWIAQEFILNKRAPRMICGHTRSVSGEQLLSVWQSPGVQAAAVGTIRTWSASHMSLVATHWLHNIRQSRHDMNEPYLRVNLRSALLWLKSFQVSEPRDKIYAALGLIEAPDRTQFAKDPGIHTDRAAPEVFRDTMVYLLKYEKTSTIFYDFPVGRYKDLDLPSWVLNFDLNTLKVIRSFVRLGDVTSDHLDSIREEVMISEDRSALVVRGHRLDRIWRTLVFGSGLVPDWNDQDEHAKTLQMPPILHEIRRTIQDLNGCDQDQACPEPLWKTLIAGVYGSLAPHQRVDEIGLQQRFDELMAIPIAGAVGLPTRTLEDEEFRKYYLAVLNNFSSEPNILAMIVRTLTIGRSFVTGHSGCYGLSEPGAQVGDVVVLLFPDHFVPFVLRPVERGYEMVGVAYIPGPMLESAIATIKADRTTLDSFTIV